MSSMPPLSEIRDAAIFVVIPAFGVTCLVAWLIPLCRGRRTRSVAAVIAFVAGVATANWLRGCATFRFQPDEPLSIVDFGKGVWSAITGQMLIIGGTEADPIYPPKPGRYWIPWAMLFALVAGLIARRPRIPFTIQLLIRLIVVGIASRMIVPANLIDGTPWATLLIVLVIFLIWTIPECLPARITAGISTAAAGLALLGAAAILLHAHSARLTDAATLVAFAAFGITVVSQWDHIDAAAAIPAVAISLPGILASGHYETFSQVPGYAFALPALAPLMTAVLPLMPDRLLRGWRVWVLTAILVGLPTLGAIVAASRAEKLDFASERSRVNPRIALLGQCQDRARLI